MAPVVVLISGANRGIGKELLQRYLQRPNHILIAANRNPDHPSSKELNNLPKASDTHLIIVKVDSLSDTDPQEAVSDLEKQGVTHIDVVIANAGVSYKFGKVSEIKIKDVNDHVEINAYGVVRLYQAALPLLLKSANPKWVTVGSTAGSIGIEFQQLLIVRCRAQLEMDNAAYGPSKAMAHWYTKRMNGEEEKLTAFSITPGWVPTDMGTSGARLFGFDDAPDSLDESCDNMIKIFDVATKEAHGGKFWIHTGEEGVW